MTDFEEKFVHHFLNSSSRPKLFTNFCKYLNILHELVDGHFYQWIDGSFVTSKLNPRDIDFVTFIPWERYSVIEPSLDDLRLLRNITEFGMDGYFVPEYPLGHKNRILFEADRHYWLNQFGKSRNEKSKGIIKIRY